MLSLILKALSVWAFMSWTIFMGVLRLICRKSVLVRYLDTEVTQHVRELKALNAEQAKTITYLTPADQVLYYTHFKGPWQNTRGGTANYRYWRNASPEPYANLYRKLGYGTTDVETLMQKANMPVYFRKAVHKLIAS